MRAPALLLLLLAACGEGKTAARPDTDGPDPLALRDPTRAREACPEVFKVRFDTSAGPITVEVRRSWSPDGAKRLYNLVRIGYFDDIAFFRVVPGFVAQFGIHGDPDISREWSRARIADDPPGESNRRGTLVFATAGPNTRTTQLFFNLGDNTRLDAMGFTPVGEIVQGLDVLDRLHAGYGESMPEGRGPVQRRIEQEGNGYLRANFPNLDFIVRAEIVE